MLSVCCFVDYYVCYLFGFVCDLVAIVCVGLVVFCFVYVWFVGLRCCSLLVVMFWLFVELLLWCLLFGRIAAELVLWLYMRWFRLFGLLSIVWFILIVDCVTKCDWMFGWLFIDLLLLYGCFILIDGLVLVWVCWFSCCQDNSVVGIALFFGGGLLLVVGYCLWLFVVVDSFVLVCWLYWYAWFGLLDLFVMFVTCCWCYRLGDLLGDLVCF